MIIRNECEQCYFYGFQLTRGKSHGVSNDRIMWLIFYPFVRKTIKNSCLFVCFRLAVQCFFVLMKRFFRPPPLPEFHLRHAAAIPDDSRLDLDDI